MRIHQINLQPAVGGGEVYTRAFTRALAEAGAEVFLYVARVNRFWDGISGERVRVVALDTAAELERALPAGRSIVLTQGPLPEELLDRLARRHVLTGFAHMPMLGRGADSFRRYALALTVSEYCVGLLRAAGLSNVYPEPLYGTCEPDRASGERIVARSPYLWDTRKLRDRLLGMLEPLAAAWRAPRAFEKGAGLTLGIVSWISPIKQYPLLFSILAPLLAARPAVRLEIFGHGGYAQVRDLKRALAPLSDRARFWGHQENVAAVYPHLDYLLTGLPEKEALGLNVLEAQACGTPVLAPRAPPFTETVLEGASGFLYRDPREDQGAELARVVDSILGGRARPDPRRATEHLAKFSHEALVGRTRRLLEHLGRTVGDAAG